MPLLRIRLTENEIINLIPPGYRLLRRILSLLNKFRKDIKMAATGRRSEIDTVKTGIKVLAAIGEFSVLLEQIRIGINRQIEWERNNGRTLSRKEYTILRKTNEIGKRKALTR